MNREMWLTERWSKSDWNVWSAAGKAIQWHSETEWEREGRTEVCGSTGFFSLVFASSHATKCMGLIDLKIKLTVGEVSQGEPIVLSFGLSRQF